MGSERPRRRLGLLLGSPESEEAEALREALRREPGVRLVETLEEADIHLSLKPGRPGTWRAILLAADEVGAGDAPASELRADLPAGALVHALYLIADGYHIHPVPQRHAREGPRPRLAAPTPRPQLTPREQAVLALLAEGASNKVIARRLAISPRTAKFHVASVLQKLGARSRLDAVSIGIRLGLVLI